MANTKTPILTGTEVCLTDLGGQNVAVKNLSDGSVWASAFPNITAGADNVIEIPAGGGEVVLDARGTVYLLGTGKVQCTGTPYATPNFRQPSSSSGGGGGTGDVTKAYVDAQDSTTLGAAKSYTDTAVNAVKSDVTANADKIADLQTDMTAAQNAITTNSTAIATAQTAAETAQSAADTAQTTANTAKSTADAAQTAASSAQSTADSAQAAADTNAANITSTAASTLKSAKTYTDTQTDALDTRITATETAITTLNGTGAGSVSKAVSDGIAEVVAGAPASFDTLKEISDWISGHSDSAAEMNSQIQTNAENIADLETDKADKSEIPTTLPANGGDSDTVNGHTVNSDVPEDAKFTDTTYSIMTGATASAAGKSGLVPAPATGSQAASFLKASGGWASPLTPVQVTSAVDLNDFTASGCYYFASNNSPQTLPQRAGTAGFSTPRSALRAQNRYGLASAPKACLFVPKQAAALGILGENCWKMTSMRSLRSYKEQLAVCLPIPKRSTHFSRHTK